MANPHGGDHESNGHPRTQAPAPGEGRQAGPGPIDRLTSFVLDRVAPQMGAFDWYRQNFTGQFHIAGPLRFLNIGTGGGVETVRLLRKGNHVTTIEYDRATAERTRHRIVRSGFGDRHVGHVGHVLEAQVDGPFDGVMMCEVLEHIRDDFKTLQRVARWLAPGGRLILSTPTASWGLLPGDEVSETEDGGHVRVGYDGPELDAMFADLGLITLRRMYVGHRLVRWHIRMERRLYASVLTRPIGRGVSLASRPLMPWLDAVPGRPLCQLTIAVKRHR
jgi:SAM-dependent methyltransferase